MEMLAVRVKKVEEEDARKRLEERMERGFQEDSSKASSVNVSGMFEAMNTDQDQQKSSGGKFKPDGWTPDKWDYGYSKMRANNTEKIFNPAGNKMKLALSFWCPKVQDNAMGGLILNGFLITISCWPSIADVDT